MKKLFYNETGKMQKLQGRIFTMVVIAFLIVSIACAAVTFICLPLAIILKLY